MKTFKFKLLFIFSMLSQTIFSQWIQQGLGYELLGNAGTISIVNSEVVWTGFMPNYQDIPVYCRTIDGGDNWSLHFLNNYQGSLLIRLESVSAYIAWFMIANNNGSPIVLKTVNGGQDLVEQNDPVFDTNYISKIHFYDENEGFIAGRTSAYKFFFASTHNGGLNWIAANPADLPNPLYQFEQIDNYFDKGNYFNNKIFLNTTKGNLLVSDDKGLHWSIKYPPLSTGLFGILYNCVFFNELSGIFYNDDGQMAETSDGGNTWNQFNPVGPCSVNICYVPGTFNSMVSSGFSINGSGQECSYSTDGGHTWTIYPELADKQPTSCSFLTTTTGWVGAPTFPPNYAQTGIYKFNGSFSEILETDPRKGGIVMYPNPSSGNVNTTIIGFKGNKILFQLSDRVGQVVYAATISQSQGQSELSFDFSHLPKGLYIATFITKDKMISKKLVLE